ncbi:MAG: acetate--CoA ligase [Firmicutes bacterium]|nr:acetate--CoA ligase [Bacillota bacterium]
MRDLTHFFNPRRVAVIGASKTPGKVGNSILKNIIESGYPGEIYPVNPGEPEILGLPCKKNIGEIPGTDLAIICVPAALVPQVVEECGKARTRNIIVISAGFKEVGKEGAALENRMVELCRRYDMNMMGPNCLGMVDTHVPLNASFAPDMPMKGEIAFISQSGAFGTAILDWSLNNNVGFSKFVSLGNKAHLDEIDFIENAADDPNTKVILCYLESITQGKRFLEVVGKATRKKPVLILKSGTSEAGVRAASSHTGALAGNDRAYDAAFLQTGVLRVETAQELFDLALAFTTQPLPKGRRVALITNAGGPGIVATDAVERMGLEMARFDPATVKELRGKLPAESNIYNPVDVIGDARPERYELALDIVLPDPNVDTSLVIVTPQAQTNPPGVADVVLKVRASRPEKPLLVSMVGGKRTSEGVEKLTRAGMPCFVFPERAVSAIAGLTRYATMLAEPLEEVPFEFPVDQDRVRAILESVRADKRNTLLGTETARVAQAYGIKAAPSGLAKTPDEAARVAEELGFPVALKIASPRILHKTDVGGVKLKLDTPEKVRECFVEIIENVEAHMQDASIYGVEVQHMMPPGRELIIGMVRDLQFGPMLMFGLGGIYVNLLKDVSFRLAYGLRKQDVEAMVRETKAYTLLRGFRGEAPADIPAIQDTLIRVARLARDFPEILEMDINPLFAYEAGKGVTAIDMKITIS